MILRPQQLRPLSSNLHHIIRSGQQTNTRCLHNHVNAAPVPSPTPFVPDVQTFLTLIGRNLSQHAAKIPSWEALFTLSSSQLKELGVDPPRSRRYLLRWRNKFREGYYGICGDALTVVDGAAQVKVVEVPVKAAKGVKMIGTATSTPGTRKVVANIPAGVEPSELPKDQVVPIKGLKIKGAQTIVGPHVIPTKGAGGGVAKIAVKEGLWEDRRGHKIDGGERRQAEVRAKRRAEEKKNSR
jgi:hypothetical protein